MTIPRPVGDDCAADSLWTSRPTLLQELYAALEKQFLASIHGCFCILVVGKFAE